MQNSTALSTAPVADEPELHESIHVHAVYDKIASHFSSTRYKPWPIIAQFIASLPSGSVGLDSGTGNGKYLPLPYDRPSSVWTIGLDRSRNLLEIAQNARGKTREVVWGDALASIWRAGAFDYAISIATIHHFSTPERRKLAIETLLRCVSPTNGRLLIYVWAVEQDHLSKRVLPSTGKIETTGRDVFVPWALSKPSSKAPEQGEGGPSGDGQVFNRYYHMFTSGELNQLAREAATSLGLEISQRPAAINTHGARKGVEIVRDGWERSNWYIEMRRWEV